ncbi:myosin-11-like [Mytilus edulis]|uniref:myosin-11-like n=1 Tax=Mytilus edulis TaxID=6550 RepID=UPI0039EE2BB5
MAAKQTVNINTASIEELMTLKDIGQKRAQLIVAERSKLGTLTAETLKAIEGIPSNIWDPFIFMGKVVFEEQLDTKETEIGKSVQQDNQQVTTENKEIVTKQQDQLQQQRDQLQQQQDQLQQQEKVIEDYKTKLMIADQDKKSMQQDVKKQLSDVKSQCTAQLTAKAEELEEVLDSMQKYKNKFEQELHYVKIEERQRCEELESTLESERKEFEQHLLDMQHKMKMEAVQKSQELEESFYQLKTEREMLMNKVEEQARLIDNDREKIKSQQKELEVKDQQHATRVQKLEEDYKTKTFSKLVETTGNLAPDNVYKSKIIPKVDADKTAVKIAENKSSVSTVKSTPKTTLDERPISRHRNEGPIAPKLATFDGKSEWKLYYLQFIHIANKYNWDTQQKLDKLIECLREKALKFFSTRPLSIQTDFKLLADKLNQRFGNKDLPYTIRRQLQDVRQNGDEMIEEFAERIQEMATDGYIDTPEHVVETISVDAFLKGCTDKKAALLAMEKSPTRMDQALQFVKSSIHNQRVLLGYKKSDVRRVQFEKYDQDDSDDDSEIAVRVVNKKPNYVPWQETIEKRVIKTEQDITGINNNVGKILKILETRGNDNRRPRSPSPSRSPARTVTCYTCNQEGHYSNQCENKNNNSSPMRRNRSPSPVNSRPKVHLNEQGSKK